MLNLLTTTLLTTCVTLACVCPAQACSGACGCAMTHSMPPAAASAAPTDPHAGMRMSQGAGTRTYQSFSYEPGVGSPVQPARTYSTTGMSGMRSYRQKQENAAATGKFR